jgi:hypothetical protein
MRLAPSEPNLRRLDKRVCFVGCTKRNAGRLKAFRCALEKMPLPSAKFNGSDYDVMNTDGPATSMVAGLDASDTDARLSRRSRLTR